MSRKLIISGTFSQLSPNEITYVIDFSLLVAYFVDFFFLLEIKFKLTNEEVFPKVRKQSTRKLCLKQIDSFGNAVQVTILHSAVSKNRKEMFQ
jgi:hypothetical protein